MPENLSPPHALAMRKAGYLLALLTPLLMPAGWLLGRATHLPNLLAWYSIFWIFGVIPLLDYAIGRDTTNPDEAAEAPAMQQEIYYRVLTLLAVPIQVLLLAWSGWVFAHGDLDLWGRLGWLLSMGAISGVNAINIGHELIHRHGRLESWAGGTLLALVAYGGFKVEHVRGHHVHVSTPLDASSARYGQSLYEFLPHAWKWNFLNAWRIEAEHLHRRDLSALHWRNELIWWYGLSVAIAVAMTWAFGWLGLLFFCGQSFVAFTELEGAAQHYILDLGGIDSRPAHRFGDRIARKLGTAGVVEGAAIGLSDRRPGRRHDYCFTHSLLSLADVLTDATTDFPYSSSQLAHSAMKDVADANGAWRFGCKADDLAGPRLTEIMAVPGGLHRVLCH